MRLLVEVHGIMHLRGAGEVSAYFRSVCLRLNFFGLVVWPVAVAISNAAWCAPWVGLAYRRGSDSSGERATMVVEIIVDMVAVGDTAVVGERVIVMLAGLSRIRVGVSKSFVSAGKATAMPTVDRIARLLKTFIVVILSLAQDGRKIISETA